MIAVVSKNGIVKSITTGVIKVHNTNNNLVIFTTDGVVETPVNLNKWNLKMLTTDGVVIEEFVGV